MSKMLRYTTLLVLASFAFLSASAAAQVKKPSKPQSAMSKTSKAAKASTKPPLQSLELVSPDKLAQSVAEEESTKARTTKTRAGVANPAGLNQNADGAVLEFRPAGNSPFSNPPSGGVEAKTGKKSLLKNIHGSVYGAAIPQAGQANAEGGAVGADSKSGNLSIFVRGEHAHASTPAPH